MEKETPPKKKDAKKKMFNLESDTDITPAPRKGSRWPPGDPQRESDPDGIMPPLMNPNCDMGKK